MDSKVRDRSDNNFALKTNGEVLILHVLLLIDLQKIVTKSNVPFEK